MTRHDNSIRQWFGRSFDDGPWECELDDPMLRHLSDDTISALADSYDDPRIDGLIRAYVTLRSVVGVGEPL